MINVVVTFAKVEVSLFNSEASGKLRLIGCGDSGVADENCLLCLP